MARPWLRDSTPKKKNEKIINPIFKECCELIVDPFWVRIFTNAARGKFPRKFSYYNDCLNYRRSPSVTKSVDKGDTIPETTSLFINFFQSNGALFSDYDQQLVIESMSTENHSEIESWADINGQMRRVMISEYANYLKEKYSLSPKEYTELHKVINHAFIFKRISGDDVNIKKNKISSINGLKFNKEDRSFKISGSNMKVNIIPISKRPYIFYINQDKFNIRKEWKKFLNVKKGNKNKDKESSASINIINITESGTNTDNTT